MKIESAEDAKRELDKIVRRSDDDALKAIAARVLSLLLDMRTLHKRLALVEDLFEKALADGSL